MSGRSAVVVGRVVEHRHEFLAAGDSQFDVDHLQTVLDGSYGKLLSCSDFSVGQIGRRQQGGLALGGSQYALRVDAQQGGRARTLTPGAQPRCMAMRGRGLSKLATA